MKSLILLTCFLLAAPADAGVAATRETLRQHTLRLINRDRTAAGLSPLTIDPAVSAAADAYGRAQIRNRTTGHFTVDGLAPYARYSLAGTSDALLENTAGWSAAYPFTEKALYEMVQRSHDAMMAERPPEDGHRRALLDPYATHAAIGVAWERGEFRLVQLMIRRWVTWDRPLARSAHVGQTVSGSGRVSTGTDVEAISVHHEPIPVPLSPAVASARDEYSLPESRRDYAPRRAGDVGDTANRGITAALRTAFPLHPDGSFHFTVPFTDGPGLYTVVVWARRGDSLFAASNVSIRVEAPGAAVGVNSMPHR